MGDTIVQLFYSLTDGLIGIVRDARSSGLENFCEGEHTLAGLDDGIFGASTTKNNRAKRYPYMKLIFDADRKGIHAS
jgi:hypothetical protein